MIAKKEVFQGQAYKGEERGQVQNGDHGVHGAPCPGEDHHHHDKHGGWYKSRDLLDFLINQFTHIIPAFLFYLLNKLSFEQITPDLEPVDFEREAQLPVGN